jgi:hypothetical protein
MFGCLGKLKFLLRSVLIVAILIFEHRGNVVRGRSTSL